MINTEQKFASLEEAMKWIGEKYVFNKENYAALPDYPSVPEWKKLTLQQTIVLLTS